MTTDQLLAGLTAQEEELMRVVHGLSGTMEAKHQTLLETEVYAKYAAIHASYTELATQNQEALKRAIFIQWYWTAEPSIYSGIWTLDDAAVDQALLLLEQRLLTDDLDQEWSWMLPWCYSIMEVIFERVEYNPRFQQILAAYSAAAWQAEPVLQPLEQRGIMGRYWLSMQDSHTHFQNSGLT